jgi:DNA helicase-2/ATP-dependent DNA helicase PcrA
MLRIRRAQVASVSDFPLPSITDGDIAWVCDVLKLPKTAFSGPDGLDPRREVLKSTGTLDVEACPGSGKTTLLVAKLAILARKWTDPRRGICVLSHTNVARREIEQRLGNTAAGQQLLSYPHFVGTIHGFVNEFLAFPCLRSHDLPVRMIDDDVCQRRRWGKLKWTTRNALEKAGHNPSIMKFKTAKLDLGDIRWGKASKLGRETETYKALQAACKTVAEEGFYCFDEMFLFADHLLEVVPDIREIIRHRFPLLFIDEVQDNSEMQSSLLFRLFHDGGIPVIRQRYGDSNQAIYRYAGDDDVAVTDKFPDQTICKDIPNSYRFGQQIAGFAKPLGVVPQNLVGNGPPINPVTTDTTDKHAILLFDDATISYVLPSYSAYLCELFSAPELRQGSFTTVGAVHRPSEDNNHLPRHVGNYWSDYDAELAASEPKPRTFCQYYMAGLKRAEQAGEAYPLVELLAEGLIALARRADPLVNFSNHQRKHRYLLQLLSAKPQSRAAYLEFVTSFAANRSIPSPDEWKDKWVAVVKLVASEITGSAIDANRVAEFLDWEQETATTLRQRDNRFKYPDQAPAVEVRLGSIHSIKGETHTATLVCDTYFRAHHLATLKPWLLGEKSGGGQQSALGRSRLKQHYVAITRPTHLLCLAMREDALTVGEIVRLKARKWRVGRVTNGPIQWI